MKIGSLAIAFVLAAAAPATADMTVCVKTDSDCPCGSVTVEATEYCYNYGGCSDFFEVLLCNFDKECEGGPDDFCGSPPGTYDQISKAGIADCTDSIPTDCFDAAGPTPTPPTPAPPTPTGPTPTAPTDMPTSAGTILFNAVPLVACTVSYLLLN